MSQSGDSSGEVRRSKIALRQAMRRRLATLDPARFHDAGCAVTAPLLAAIGPDAPVSLFASRAGEIDTGPLDQALRRLGRRRAAPRIDGVELSFRWVEDAPLASLPLDAYSIPTPGDALPRAALCDCAVIVPGLAFDVRGGRLGHGRGYYDRALLAADLERCIGVCLDEQIVDEVPMDVDDVRLRWLCTPGRGVFRAAI